MAYALIVSRFDRRCTALAQREVGPILPKRPKGETAQRGKKAHLRRYDEWFPLYGMEAQHSSSKLLTIEEPSNAYTGEAIVKCGDCRQQKMTKSSSYSLFVDLAFQQLSTPCHKKRLADQVIELRESRLDHEEALAEVQKATDEHKRNLDRQVSLSASTNVFLPEVVRGQKALDSARWFRPKHIHPCTRSAWALQRRIATHAFLLFRLLDPDQDNRVNHTIVPIA